MLPVVHLKHFYFGFFEKQHIPALYYWCHLDNLTFRKKVATLKILVSAHAAAYYTGFVLDSYTRRHNDRQGNIESVQTGRRRR